MTTLGERVATIAADARHTVEVLEKVLEHTSKTNGRVTALERWQIAVEAREAERARLEAERAAQAAADDRRWTRRRAWVPSTLTALACVVLGSVLGHIF